MQDEEFRDRFKDIAELAEAVHAYATGAWPIVGHRPRIFVVGQKTSLWNKGKKLWLTIWTYSGEQPRFLCAEYTGYNWSENRLTGLNSRPPNSPTNLLNKNPGLYTNSREEERDVVLHDLNVGLAELFEYIQAECKRGFAECWGSVDAERRWNTYDQEFVERVNTKRLVAVLLKNISGIAQAGFDLHSKFGPHGYPEGLTLTPVFQFMQDPARRALELAKRVEEANKQRKLFVDWHIA